VTALQRQAGNAAVTALVGEPTAQRAIDDGHDLSSPRFAGVPILEACFDDQARLGEGTSGDAVTRVQQALLDLGGNLGPTGVDGKYGPATAAAVRAFKAKEKLGFEQFGDVGPGTMRRLDELFPGPSPVPPTPTDDGGKTVDVDDDIEPGSCPTPSVLTEALAEGPDDAEAVRASVAFAFGEPALPVGGAPTGPGSSLDKAADDFASRLNAPGSTHGTTIVGQGQFFWSTQVEDEVNDVLAGFAGDPGAAAYVTAARAFLRAVNKHKQRDVTEPLFQAVVAAAKAAKSPNKAAMTALLATGAKGTASEIETKLWAAVNKTNSVPSVLHLRSLAVFRALFEFDLTSCGFAVTMAARRVRQRGGPGNKTPVGPSMSAELVAGPGKRDRREIAGTGRMFGDVIPQQGVASAVAKLQKAIDNGHMIHARVLSGAGYGKGCVKQFENKAAGALGPATAEHSLLIFARDGDTFLFSDSDASVSKTPKQGFGVLHFADDRLSTADGAADLPVTLCGNHTRGDKRYQVMSLFPA
jgi:peptidoglycan hydrolase-like protein with peptidoglycan-binding domain